MPLIDLTSIQSEPRIAALLAAHESRTLEFKRLGDNKVVRKLLEATCAFANTQGGVLALGVADEKQGKGAARLYGIQENPEALDEFQRKLRTHLHPLVENVRLLRLPCILRDGSAGQVVLVQVPQSDKVHSIIDDGTWTRLDAGNREMTAPEIADLSYRRGVRSAENMKKPPRTLRGPLVRLIDDTVRAVLDELSAGVELASSGLKAHHRYPERVVKEAIVNAVIHRDYRLNRDILIRIFDDRIEVESPGMLPGAITPANIERAGSKARNPLIVKTLRDFPVPPNFDLNEGVPMMFAEMAAARLYPPQYRQQAEAANESVTVTLLNLDRPSVWDEVSDWIDRNGPLANADLCRIADLDTLKASKLLKTWVGQNLLEPLPDRAKRNMAYTKPSQPSAQAGLLSEGSDNKPDGG